ncbi:MAG: hypothetical protein QOF51_2220 [Chloroflexota bacterium]|jgi:hypothetical protein|nr:hypothetical protein [Chloroflexota bacterium]
MLQSALVWTRRRLDVWALSRTLGYALVVGALLYPSVLLAVDHHGAERIPTHEHPAVDGVIPTHVHGFEVPHIHIHSVSVLAGQPTAPIIGEPSLILMILFATMAMAFVGGTDGLCRIPCVLRWVPNQDGDAQVNLIPPTPPPTHFPTR